MRRITPTQLRTLLRAAGWSTCERLPSGARVEEFETPSGVSFVVPLALVRPADSERLRVAIGIARSGGVVG